VGNFTIEPITISVGCRNAWFNGDNIWVVGDKCEQVTKIPYKNNPITPVLFNTEVTIESPYIEIASYGDRVLVYDIPYLSNMRYSVSNDLGGSFSSVVTLNAIGRCRTFCLDPITGISYAAILDQKKIYKSEDLFNTQSVIDISSDVTVSSHLVYMTVFNNHLMMVDNYSKVYESVNAGLNWTLPGFQTGNSRFGRIAGVYPYYVCLDWAHSGNRIYNTDDGWVTGITQNAPFNYEKVGTGQDSLSHIAGDGRNYILTQGLTSVDKFWYSVDYGNTWQYRTISEVTGSKSYIGVCRDLNSNKYFITSTGGVGLLVDFT
jgi:hypothetical protein